MNKKSIFIRTITGNVLLSDASAEVRVFHCKKSEPERFLSQSAKYSTDGSIKSSGVPHYSSSITGKTTQTGGLTVIQNFNIEEGEIIKVFVKINNGYGTIPKVASIYLRVRESAAYRSLKIKLFDFAKVAFKTATIEGNFDLLTVEDVESNGIKVKFPHLSTDRKINSVLTENKVIQEEKLPAIKKETVTIVDSDTGESKTMVRVKKKRSISI